MIPTKALSINIDTAHLNLNDIELLQGTFTVKGFKAFMERHSNWTADDVGLLEVSELEQVFNEFSDKLKESSVPKVNGSNSQDGRREPSKRPRGRV